MKKISNWISFNRQIMLVCVLTFLGLLLATLTKHSVFANIGWVLSGLLFIINPTCPEKWKWRYGENEDRMKRDFRIGGAAVIFIGLITQFGV